MQTGTRYKQISHEERIVIQKLLEANRGKREIARVLNRSSGSICNEVKVNSVKGIYTAEKAELKSYQARWRAKSQCLKLGNNSKLAKRVDDRLKLKYSPDQISGELKEEGVSCSKKAIYKYVKSRCLESKLMFKGKRRKSKWKYQKGVIDKEKKYIELRPKVQGLGHYEMDFVVSKHNNYSLLVLVDKWSRFAQVRLITDRKHITVTSALRGIFENTNLPMLSVTTDNDISFSHWKYLENTLNTKIYFTHPYHSWEKGLVENTNRWIRLFAPKQSDLSLVTTETLVDIHNFLNKKPRKVLGYKTAESVYFSQRECVG
jgi:transposase, IS30 family